MKVPSSAGSCAASTAQLRIANSLIEIASDKMAPVASRPSSVAGYFATLCAASAGNACVVLDPDRWQIASPKAVVAKKIEMTHPRRRSVRERLPCPIFDAVRHYRSVIDQIHRQKSFSGAADGIQERRTTTLEKRRGPGNKLAVLSITAERRVSRRRC